jgi:putative FmdB family regulatory protein
MMPFYEYECPNGHIVEKLERTDSHEIECPECHEKAHKIISLCTFKLKGGGWYADGYASKKS